VLTALTWPCDFPAVGKPRQKQGRFGGGAQTGRSSLPLSAVQTGDVPSHDPVTRWATVIGAVVTFLTVVVGVSVSVDRATRVGEDLTRTMDERFDAAALANRANFESVNGNLEQIRRDISRLEDRVLDLERRAPMTGTGTDGGATPDNPIVESTVANLRLRLPGVGVTRTFTHGRWGLWVDRADAGATGSLRALLADDGRWRWFDEQGHPARDPREP